MGGGRSGELAQGKGGGLKASDKRKARDKLWKKSRGKCAYCGKQTSKSEFTIDHFVPKARGGGNEFWNFRLCCFACNQAKSDCPPWRFLEAIKTANLKKWMGG